MRTKLIIAASVLLGMAVGVLFMPTAVQAWPWDRDDQVITVGGYAFCTGFNLSAPAGRDHAANLARAFNPPVEDFTIRGRSNIVKAGSPMRWEYEIKVPSGWVVEWSLDCEGVPRTNGSFKVDSSMVGTHQTRHICSEKVGLSPCRPPEYAGCALLLVNGAISLPVGREFGETLGGLADAAKNGYGVEDALANPKACLEAIAADTGVRRSAQPAPAVPAPAAPLPVPDRAIAAPLPIVPPAPAAPAEQAPAPQAPAAPAQQAPAPQAPLQPLPQQQQAPPQQAAPQKAPPQPAPPAQQAPAPQQPTYAQTTGGNTNTWTNPSNAGGQQGQTIPARTTVQISCKLPGFKVANGNTWWYRIASGPWSDAFYASADAFYNNGATSGPLTGTPYVDPAVRDC